MGVLDQKVAEIATKLNTLLEKAKTTDQFPYQANLNANSKIRVYTDGISEFIMVSQLLPSVEETDNKVLDYTIEWVKGTYTFKITVRKYIFNGVLHTNTIYAERTLGASDLVYNRFDSFLIDANEQIIVWPGDAVEFPYPKEFDLDTYVLINFFRVDANTTEPAGLSEILVFDEGTGDPGEWTMDYLSGTLNTTKFSSGAKCIKLVNKQSVAATAAVNYEGRFIKDVLIDVFCETAGNNRLRFSFWIANTMRVGDITVSHGQFNFNSFLIGQWQTIVIPGSAFSTSWGNSQYNYLWMNNDRSGSTVYLDNVRIQQTDTEAVSGTNHTHANLSVLEQITQALINAWNNASTWITTNGANVLTHIANKQNSLATDGTGGKYPTVDAVNAGLATKLDASAYNQHFKGIYLTFAALVAANPTGEAGDYAQVNEVGAADVLNYNWDTEENVWIPNAVGGSGATNTDELPEGTVNLYHTGARVLATILSGLSIITGGDVVATDTIIQAFGKLQKNINTLWIAVNLNTAKVSFPEAPSDTKTYGRKDAGWIEVAASGGTSVHNDLTGIQGGSPGDYQHLTNVEKTLINDFIGNYVMPIPEIPVDWLDISSLVIEGEQKFVGLHQVWNSETNYVTVKATISTGAQFKVNWGNGVETLHNSGTIALGNLVYADYGNYTENGYRQAIITVTPVTGNFTVLDFSNKHNASLPNGYPTGWNDMKISSATITSLILYSTAVSHINLFKFDYVGINAISNFTNFFNGCRRLKNLNIDTASGTNFQSMFQSCSSLQTIPLINTASGTSFLYMFSYCSNLSAIPDLQAHISLTAIDYFSWLLNCPKLSYCGIIGVRNTISYVNCLLDKDNLVIIFNNLETVTAKTITITGNPGASLLTAGDRLIATNKGWTIVG